MPARTASTHAIRRAAAQALGADAMSIDALVRALQRAGLELPAPGGEALLGALADDPRFQELHDDTQVFVPTLLAGTTWTARIPEELPGPDCLRADPDLTLLAWWALAEPIPLVDPSGGRGARGALESVELDDGTDGVLGPPGWLEDTTGSVLLVEVAADGVVLRHTHVVPVPTPRQVAAVQAAFAQAAHLDTLDGDLLAEPVELESAMLEDLLSLAVVADRSAFVDEVIPPVDELLAAAGLEREGVTVAEQGMDWGALDRWRWRRRLGRFHDLDDEDVESVEILLTLSLRFADGDPGALGPAGSEVPFAKLVAFCLADDAIALAFVGEHAERETPPEVLAGFAGLVLGHVDDESAAGVRWLLARSLDRLGDPLGARAELELAVATGVGFFPAHRALAALRSDAGDATGGLELLDHLLDDPDLDLDLDESDPLFDEVAFYAAQRPRAEAGRNAPCPCGSGRKYKVCHLGKEQLPLVDRAPWLYAKARRYLHDNRFRRFGAEIASTIAEAADPAGVGATGLLLSLLDSELVDDLALCELGVFETFVAERDAILPDDEALLAASWALVARSLFEVERAHGDTLALRDLRTGEHVVVTNVHGNETTGPGSLFVGRPLPVGDTWRAFAGFVPVSDALRDDMLAALDAGDPFAIAAAIGWSLAPPQLRNTDGESLRFHEIRYRVADPARATRRFAATELHDVGDGSFTLVRDTANQADTVIASFELQGDELLVTANSDARADEARALVAGLLPDAVLVDHDHRGVDEMLAERRELADDGADRADRDNHLDDPAMAAALAEYVQHREQLWVDESIPALDGMTPREAAQDPIGRPALERLLQRFEGMAVGPGGFDVARLRKLLDL